MSIITIICAPFKFVWAILKWFCHVLILLEKPLEAIKKQPGIFFLWFAFTIIAGLLGPIINVINNCWFERQPLNLSAALFRESLSGTFYTFAVVLIASSIGVVLLKLIEFKDSFKKVKLYFVAICIFPMLIGAVCYSSHMRLQAEDIKTTTVAKTEQNCGLQQKQESNLAIDNIQLTLFVIAILVAIYSFCLQYMSLFPEEFKILDDDYAGEEQERVDQKNEGTDDPNAKYKGAKLND